MVMQGRRGEERKEVEEAEEAEEEGEEEEEERGGREKEHSLLRNKLIFWNLFVTFEKF